MKKQQNTERSLRLKYISHGVLAACLVLFCCGPMCVEGQSAGTYTHDEGRVLLRCELVEFEQYVEATMKTARRMLQDRGVTAQDIKKLDAWQNAQLARFRSALRQEDPRLALMDAWAIGESLSTYLEQASADELPQTVRDVALDMLKRREDHLAYIASRYLGEDSFAALSNQIEGYATDQTIPKAEVFQADSQRWTIPLFSAWSKGRSTVSGILELPLMPGRALKGVSESGKALTGIRETADNAVLVANELPERIRTEFQIALADLVEKRAEIIDILNAIDSISTNLRVTAQSTHLTATEIQTSLALARELLPAGESLAAAVERAVNASTGLAKTIGELSARTSAADGTPRREFDVTEYKSTAEAITLAAGEIRQMLVEIQTLTERAGGPDGTEPKAQFDIQHYGAAAESIRGSAAEIRALIRELHEISADDEAALRSAGLLQRSVDHCAWRLIQVAAVVFLLACVHTSLRMKWRRKEHATDV